ncbi:MAG: hypothetical protein ACFBSD_01975 [Paracoccaceae bacterium]
MIVVWIAVGALAGSCSVSWLARDTRRLAEGRAVPVFLLSAVARILLAAGLGLPAFLSDPAHGVGFVAGLAAGRIATLRTAPDRWLG